VLLVAYAHEKMATSNDLGYKILNGVRPTPDKVEAAKAEISIEYLHKLQQSISSLGFERLGWGKDSDVLLHDGLDVRSSSTAPGTRLTNQLHGDEYLKNMLHGSYANAKLQMADVVVWMQNYKQLQRVRAGRGRVFIYKAVEGTLSPENGFFRVVEGSHLMGPEQVMNAKAKDIYLEPGQAIIVDGELIIEYPQTGGGIGLLKCISKA
jgi:hypothetical protein